MFLKTPKYIFPTKILDFQVVIVTKIVPDQPDQVGAEGLPDMVFAIRNAPIFDPVSSDLNVEGS